MHPSDVINQVCGGCSRVSQTFSQFIYLFIYLFIYVIMFFLETISESRPVTNNKLGKKWTEAIN